MAYVDVDKLAIDDYRIDLSQYVKKSDLINTAHPVGDTMIRLDNINPGTLPGYEGTVWQKISEGKMLIGANSQFPLGSSGGSPTHKHSVAAMAFTGNTGSRILTAAQSGLQGHNHEQAAHSHTPANTANKFVVTPHDIILNPNKRAWTAQNPNGVHYVVAQSARDGIGEDARTANTKASNVAVEGRNATQGHDHTMNHTHPAQDTTNASSMPPYLAVNIWTRIS